ncbi:MAG: hypothetical protein ACYTGZ_06890 [Planctomycetota bacterium]|jgi:hypothetical protein
MRLAAIRFTGGFLLSIGIAFGADKAEDADAVIFLGPLKSGDGAPSAEGVARRVVVTNVADDPAWKGVFDVLKARGYETIIPFKGAKVGPAFRELRKIRPGLVTVVVPHDTLDVNWHFDFLERAARLDADPFVDFAFGYITGATPAEAVAFARGIAAADGKRSEFPQTIVEFGPVQKPYGPTSPQPHKIAKGWKTRGYWHAKDAQDVAAQLSKLKGVGIYRAGGHGWPTGVDEGLSGRALRDSGLRIHPALYFSGPCYCGVTTRWFRTAQRRIKEEEIAPEDSFLLSLIRAGATGIFAGLDPDRGETNEHELEHLLVTGDPLGFASKATYDEAVVSYRRPELKLPRYRDGKGWPFRDIHDQMISGAACRALFGDPSFQPVQKAANDPFEASTNRTKKGLEVTWRRGSDVGKYWAPVDVMRGTGGWTHRIRIRIALPIEEARKIRGFRVLHVTKDGNDVPYAYATAAVEEWAGEGRVHMLVVFPRTSNDRVLWGGKKYEAKLLLRGRR